MKKLTSIVIGFTGMLLSTPAYADNAPTPEEALKQASALSTFIADGVNLREEPSANSAYLVYANGEELYYEPENVQWSRMLGAMRIGGQLVQPDHEKIQGEKDMSLPVLGTQGDWVKLYYSNGSNPFEVWTMKKFVKTEPLGVPTTKSTYSPAGYNALCLTGDADGARAIYYQEPGMDEDEGFFIGKKAGKGIIFDRFLPMHLEYKPSTKGVLASKDPSSDMLIFSFGQDGRKGESDLPVLDVSRFSEKDIQSLVPLATPLQASETLVLIAYPDGTMGRL